MLPRLLRAGRVRRRRRPGRRDPRRPCRRGGCGYRMTMIAAIASIATSCTQKKENRTETTRRVCGKATWVTVWPTPACASWTAGHSSPSTTTSRPRRRRSRRHRPRAILVRFNPLLATLPRVLLRASAARERGQRHLATWLRSVDAPRRVRPLGRAGRQRRADYGKSVVCVVVSGQRYRPLSLAVHCQEPEMGDVPARTSSLLPLQTLPVCWKSAVSSA